MAYLHENDVGLSTRKTLKLSSNPRVERALFTWFIQERTKGTPISGEILREKAKFFYKKITKKEDFKASSGWLDKFKKRFGIRQLTVCGESLSSDYDAVLPFVEKIACIIKEKNLTSHQIYNADESGLFWRVLPNKTLAHSGEKSAPGRKVSKERITFMPCCNASGSHKLKLLVLSKSMKPRAFRNVEIPVSYKGQRRAWVTRDIFTEWFHKEFVPSVRRKMKQLNLSSEAILILDNAPGHPPQLVSDDHKISVIFLPPNCTPLIQPMDQHVIQAIKLFYRKKLLKKIVASDCDVPQSLKNVNLKDVVFFLDEAWQHVDTGLITKSWSKILPTETPKENVCDSDEEDEIPLARLARQIIEPQPVQIENVLEEIVQLGKKLDQNLTKEEIEEWVAHDKASSNELTADDIIQEIDGDSDSEGNSDDDVSKIPCLVKDDDAVSAFNTCIVWATQNNIPEHRIVFLQELRVQAQDAAIKSKKQTKITNFFNVSVKN